MGQSLVKNYIHIVFSTKHRQPLINQRIEKELHAYMGGICRELECIPLIIGGVEDHVHILCKLTQKIALMTLVQKVKANSSKWIKTKGTDLENFYWQNGYATFSVNPHEVDVVTRYIANQRVHHSKQNFKAEFRGLLAKYEMEYDEKYVWD